MAISGGPDIVEDGLVLHLDAADRNGYSVNSELVTNSNLLVQGDGNSLPCITNSSGNTQLNIGPIVSGKTYQLLWNVTNITGNVSASLRVGFAIISESTNANSIGFRKHVFTSNLTGTLNFTGNNVGCNFDVDFASLKEYNPTLVDLTGNNNNGTLTDGVAFHSPNNGYFIFDGSNDYIDCGSSVEQLSTGITVAAWYKADTIGKLWDMIVTRGSGGFSLRYNSDSRFPHFCININGIFIDQGEYSTNIQVPDEQWTYLVGVYDGSQVITYVNGISAGSYSISGSISSNTNSVLVGKRVDTNAYNFDGSIASVKMYNRGLYQNEIQQNYNATKGRFGL